MKAERRTVLINGAGIAGLTAALSLAQVNHRVEIFEQAEGFELVGAGIQVSPNALDVLAGLGLERRLKELGFAPDGIRMHDGLSGKLLSVIPLGQQYLARFGHPYLVIHRADLQNVLFAACKDHPEISVQFGQSVVDVAAHANGVTALVQKEADMSEASGRLLVAADGIWSRIRTECLGLPAPLYSGMTAFRALIPGRQFDPGPIHANTMVWLGPGAHVVTYPVRGGTYINVVAVAQEQSNRQKDHVNTAELEVKFGGWSSAVTGLFEKKARWSSWPLFEAQKVSKLAFGPIALIGDAAHAMLPFAAQGAAMAIEDAAVLSSALARYPDVIEGVRDYERRRLDRVNKVIKASRGNGQIYHMGKMGIPFRNLVMQLTTGRKLLARQAWIYDWRSGTSAEQPAR